MQREKREELKNIVKESGVGLEPARWQTRAEACGPTTIEPNIKTLILDRAK